MPNWCFNRLCIRGEATLIEQALLLMVNAKGKIDFSVAVPPPEGADMDWCCKHWGMKWGASESVMLENVPGRVSYSFNTPWCPPGPWIKVIADKFPSLVFRIAYHCEDPYYGVMLLSEGEVYDERLDPEQNEDNKWKGNGHFRRFIARYF